MIGFVLVGGGCITWKPHYRCLDDSSSVGINTTSLAPGPLDPLQEADVSKPSIMDEKKTKPLNKKDGDHG